jgi:hypothetical protein
VRKFEEGWNGVAVAVACGFDIFYTTGEKKSSRGSSSDGRKIVKKKWRVVRVVKVGKAMTQYFGRAVKGARGKQKGQSLTPHFERVQSSKETLVRTLK